MIQAISVNFTYNTTTPESSESGNFADCGFCDEFGRALTTREDDLQAVPDCAIELWETFGDLEYLIRRAIDLGIYEPSSSIITSGTWFSSPTPNINYTTGESTRYSLHIRGLSDSEMQGVADILERGYIGEDSEYWLECIERDINTQAFINSLNPDTLALAKALVTTLGKPDDNESILLTLCSNLSDRLTLAEWTVANEFYGLYQP